jgi:hypothetical protein
MLADGAGIRGRRALVDVAAAHAAPEDLLAALEHGAVDDVIVEAAETGLCGLVIDRAFGKDRHRGTAAHAFLVVNASDTATATQAMSIAAGISNQLSIQTLARRAGWKERLLPVDLRLRPWYNPDLRTATIGLGSTHLAPQLSDLLFESRLVGWIVTELRGLPKGGQRVRPSTGLLLKRSTISRAVRSLAGHG